MPPLGHDAVPSVLAGRHECSFEAAGGKLAEIRTRHGHLVCERCGFDPISSYGAELGEACIDVHAAGDPSTPDSKLECLCANCHRIAHAAPTVAG